MLEFQPFNEFTAMLLGERTEAAARQLVHALGFNAMRQATESLATQGLISSDCAAHIILDLMGTLSIGEDQIERLERLGLDVPAELGEGDGPIALQAVFSSTRMTVHSEEVAEDAPDPREQLRAIKRRVEAKDNGKGQAGEDEHTCPICGDPISRQAVGCRKHWRQVKKDMAAAG